MFSRTKAKRVQGHPERQTADRWGEPLLSGSGSSGPHGVLFTGSHKDWVDRSPSWLEIKLLASHRSLCQVYLGLRALPVRRPIAMADHSHTGKRRGDCHRATRRLLAVVLVLACGWLAACSPPPLSPPVRPGTPLSATGLRYGVSSHTRVHYHALANPDTLEIGQGLRLPPSQRRRSVSVEPSRAHAVSLAISEPHPTLRSLLPDEDWPSGSPVFAWPVDGEVTSWFGPRKGRFHDGIDIAAPQGTPVLAAADGQVIFSDVLRGYGKVVIVRHAGGYLTLYAHNALNQVQEGQRVRRGTRVATVGQSGHVTGANLHFEVRKDNRAWDPLRYLSHDTRTVLRAPSSR